MPLVSILLRWWAVFALIAAAAMLGAAHWFESQGLPPCPLCLKQREVYWAALAVAGPAVVWTLISRAKGTQRLAAFILFAIFFAGVVTATFHAGGEQGWWALPATCASVGGKVDLDSLTALALGTGPAVKVIGCGDVAWRWGLSMAGWNAVISAALAVFSLLAAKRPKDARAPRIEKA